MKDELHERFKRIRPVKQQGGQGESYQAIDKSTDSAVFVKKLKFQKNQRARKRFRREVVAYETVTGSGLPALLYDNSSQWNTARAELFMVLEWIEGVSLQEKIRRDGPISLQEAAQCVIRIGKTLSQAHLAGVAHRDIKPANIMLRNSDIADPVLVDFGLSFNAAELDGVTHVEEIGNRFLRLPEHAAEGNSRSQLSDVTQLAGLLFYCLTGREPRVLSDEEGRMPHQRAAREDLANLLSGRQLRRLQSVFDKAFDTRLARRFQSAEDLIEAIEGVVVLDENIEGDDIDSQFDELVAIPRDLASMEAEKRLRPFPVKVQEVVRGLASAHDLSWSQTGFIVEAWGEIPFAANSMRLWRKGINPVEHEIPWVKYQFELRDNEIVFMVDGVDLWRGESAEDQTLLTEMVNVAKKAFVYAMRDLS